MPVLLQPEHGVPSRAEGLHIAFRQFLMEIFQCFRRSAAGSQHTRVADQRPSQHHRLHTGIPLRYRFTIRQSDQISVVAQRILAIFPSIAEPFFPHRLFVKVLADSGVDGQFLDGIAVKNRHNFFKFLRRFHTQPGLH